MNAADSLSHSQWKCKYQMVFIPECRRRVLCEQLWQHLKKVLRRPAGH